MLVDDFDSIRVELARVQREKAEMVAGETEKVEPELSWAHYFAPPDDGS